MAESVLNCRPPYPASAAQHYAYYHLLQYIGQEIAEEHPQVPAEDLPMLAAKYVKRNHDSLNI